MRNLSFIVSGLSAVVVAALVLFGLHMAVNCVYVEEGYSLMVQYKGPLIFGSGKPALPGEFAKAGEVGIREELLGPGRHFYCPLWWKVDRVPDITVLPGKVAMVTCKIGENLPEGEFLVDGDLGAATGGAKRFKGVLRKVFGPGRYRVHPWAYEMEVIDTVEKKVGEDVKYSGWVKVPTGYVGVVTMLTGNKGAKRASGVDDNVLPPGIYPVNPYEQQIDIVEVGYRETSISVDKIIGRDGKIKVDESGEPEAEPRSGIGFPSNDGFPIQIDFTAIWGVMPADAPNVVKTFGNLREVEKKVIQPQSESICRNFGSTMGANQLLVGETRQEFQDAVSDAFQKVLTDKNLSLLYGLVRHIYIPKEVRIPLQKGYVADELKLTRDEEITTKQAEGELREAEKKVLQETEKVRAETGKMVASLLAEGAKEVGEIEAAAKQKVAEIDKEIAELDAKRTEVLGKAKAGAEQLLNEAQAQKFELAVKAFGSPDAYNKWQFAEGLPEQMQLQLFYAGQGTLWTDLKSVMPTIALPTGGSPAAEAPAPKAAAPRTRPGTSPAK